MTRPRSCEVAQSSLLQPLRQNHWPQGSSTLGCNRGEDSSAHVLFCPCQQGGLCFPTISSMGTRTWVPQSTVWSHEKASRCVSSHSTVLATTTHIFAAPVPLPAVGADSPSCARKSEICNGSLKLVFHSLHGAQSAKAINK